MDDLENEILESLPEDGESESSTEEANVETTTEQTEPKEPPFHEHPRWQEIQQEKRDEKARADRLEQQLLDISGKLATPKDSTDPYAGLEGEMKDWAKFIDQRAEVKAKAIAKQERENYMREQNLTRQQLAVIAYKEFQVRHPDIKSNSPEENEIAKRVAQGYTPDDAYELTVGLTKRKALEEELAGIKKGKQKNTQKLAANVETGGVSSTGPIQPKEKMTVAEFVDMQMRQAG